MRANNLILFDITYTELYPNHRHSSARQVINIKRKAHRITSNPNVKIPMMLIEYLSISGFIGDQ